MELVKVDWIGLYNIPIRVIGVHESRSYKTSIHYHPRTLPHRPPLWLLHPFVFPSGNLVIFRIWSDALIKSFYGSSFILSETSASIVAVSIPLVFFLCDRHALQHERRRRRRSDKSLAAILIIDLWFVRSSVLLLVLK